MTRIWAGPNTQIEDGAPQPPTRYEVNINQRNSWVNDPYFYDGNVFKAPSDDYDANVFVAPEYVDHTNGKGGGFGANITDFTPPPGKAHKDMTRAIDLNPITQNYVVYHLRKAFGENV